MKRREFITLLGVQQPNRPIIDHTPKLRDDPAISDMLRHVRVSLTYCLVITDPRLGNP